MESISDQGARVRRPGGRTADVTERINRAVLELLVEGGTEACTAINVAKRAGVERSTMYRRHADRWAMILEALVAKGGVHVAPTDSGSFAHDLKFVLCRLVAALETPLGPALVAAAAELRSREKSDYTRVHFDARMEQLDPMFRGAIERGELSPDVDKEYVFSFAAGPIYFRNFIAARRVDEEFIDSVVAATCLYFLTPEDSSGRAAF